MVTAIVDLNADVKPFLGITDSTHDAKLSTFINSASQAIVNEIGQVAGSPTVDEWHDGGSDRIVLRNATPIQSVTTVTETLGTLTYALSQITLDTGSTAGSYQYTVDLNTGVIVRRASGVAVPFAVGIRNVHVTFVAGYATVPGDIKEACLLRIKYAWDTQRGASGRNGTGPAPEFALARAEELLSRYRVPGIG